MRQQRIDILGFRGRQAREDVAQVRIGVDAVRHGRLNQAVEHRCNLAAALAGDEQVVGSPQGDGANFSFQKIVVDLQTPVFEMARRLRPHAAWRADRPQP
jgi:hypothetical protein